MLVRIAFDWVVPTQNNEQQAQIQQLLAANEQAMRAQNDQQSQIQRLQAQNLQLQQRHDQQQVLIEEQRTGLATLQAQLSSKTDAFQSHLLAFQTQFSAFQTQVCWSVVIVELA
jgi:septation ring formation regulator EzrA